ncbi:hypothetical protein GBAR_LOCUS6333 [Geodia barretti]|uniref:Uncharacterized protein n=1 Tax=Geodia barretti TaxID=519541 RepID=A0AA35RFL2_GEOBA|nr:hypothetical protein GBAR_LOCUS6333 [Geodia barretti]
MVVDKGFAGKFQFDSYSSSCTSSIAVISAGLLAGCLFVENCRLHFRSEFLTLAFRSSVMLPSPT